MQKFEIYQLMDGLGKAPVPTCTATYSVQSGLRLSSKECTKLSGVTEEELSARLNSKDCGIGLQAWETGT